jgi:spermidine synthase
MPSELRLVARNAAAAFPEVRFYLGAVPTYPGTLWSYVLAGRAIQIPSDVGRVAKERGLRGRYWTPEIHVSAFSLPRFVADIVAGRAGPLEA